MKSAILILFLVAGVSFAQSNSGPILDPAPTAKKTKKRAPAVDPSAPQTAGAEEHQQAATDGPDTDGPASSSRDTKIDLSAPANDAKDHPGVDPDPGINEFHPYDPHKAMKNIEVGDYYAKRKNFAAAISRYREALEFKPRDAEAIFKLASVLERSGERDEAAEDYAEYLKILPNGEFADQAKKGLERMKEKSGSSDSASAWKPK